MDGTEENTRPGFIQGTEVACSKRYAQPGFDGQLPLLKREQGLTKKLMVALIVISSVFMGGMIAGAVVRLFV